MMDRYLNNVAMKVKHEKHVDNRYIVFQSLRYVF